MKKISVKRLIAFYLAIILAFGMLTPVLAESYDVPTMEETFELGDSEDYEPELEPESESEGYDELTNIPDIPEIPEIEVDSTTPPAIGIGIEPLSLTGLGILWSMADDLYIQGLPLGDNALAGTPILSPSGPTITTIVDHPTIAGARSIQVSGRSADWHGLQISRAALDATGLSPGNTYEITIIGRAVVVGTGTISGPIVLRQSEGPWNNLSTQVTVSDTSPDFTINWEFYPEQDNLQGQDMRIQTPGAASNVTMSFVVDDIIITRTEIRPANFTLTVNGEAGVTTTTQITLDFFRDVTLAIADITFNPRATEAVLVAPYLTQVTASEYILHIGNSTRWGYVGITIDDPDINPDPVAVMIYHQDSVFMPNAPLRDYFPWVHDPNFRNRMPVSEMLNDPFQFFVTTDGQSGGYGEVTPNRVVTPQDWDDRRAEIRDLIMYYYAGYMWQTTAANVDVNTSTIVRGTEANVINITVNEYRLDGTPVTATADIATGVWFPTEAQLIANGFFDSGGPIIIGTGHSMSPIQREIALSRGIAVATVPGPSDARPHGATAGSMWAGPYHGMYMSLFPQNPNVTEYNTGAMMIHAWNVSRFLDALEIMQNEWRVNPNMSVTIGNSFQGKRALFAGVMDDRVALVVPHESGGDGGMAPFRGSHAGRLQHYWHDGIVRAHNRHETPRTGNAGRRAQGPVLGLLWGNQPYAESTWLTPFDMHLVAALQAGTVVGFENQTNAPGRAFLSLETHNFGTWTGWTMARTVAAAAEEVFAFLGYEDHMIFFMKNSGHAIHDSDFPVIFAILDYQFGNNGRRQNNQVYVPNVLSAALPGLWNGGLAALGRSPVEVDSFFMPWTRPGVHSLWTNNQYVSQGLPATIVAHTNAPTVDLILWSHGDGNLLWGANNPPVELGRWTAAASGGVATFNLTAEEVEIGRFELRTRGPQQDRSVFFQAIDVRSAVRSSSTSDNTGGHVHFGFGSRIDMDALNVTTTNGSTVTNLVTNSNQGVGDTWVTPFGVRVPNIPGSGDTRWYTLSNLRFEAVPGFNFIMNLQENLHNLNTDSGANNQYTVIWMASPEVQHIGPYPHFQPAGNSGWGVPTPAGAGFAPTRTTTFDPELTHEHVGVRDANGNFTRLDSWVITFSEPINPRDFGIGFNFSTNFVLNWNATNTVLTVNFNNFAPVHEELTMHIIRLRSAVTNMDGAGGEGRINRIANVYNDLISYSLPVLEEPQPTPDPTVTGVTITPDVARVSTSRSIQMVATVLGEHNPPNAVTWYIQGENIAEGTTISSTGLLTVAHRHNQQVTTITVIARSVFDPDFYGTATINIELLPSDDEWQTPSPQPPPTLPPSNEGDENVEDEGEENIADRDTLIPSLPQLPYIPAEDREDNRFHVFVYDEDSPFEVVLTNRTLDTGVFNDFVDRMVSIDPINAILLAELAHISINYNGYNIYEYLTVITADILDWNLTISQQANLTGFLFNPETGEYTFLGGLVSLDNEFFGFIAETGGYFGVVIRRPLLRFQMGNNTYHVRGYSSISEAAPFVDTSINPPAIMLPLRLVAEGLGASVIWNEESRSVMMLYDDMMVMFYVDMPLVNNFGMPTIINGRTFVPIAYIEEIFLITVTWDAENQVVYINYILQ